MPSTYYIYEKSSRLIALSFFMCVGHDTNLVGANLLTSSHQSSPS